MTTIGGNVILISHNGKTVLSVVGEKRVRLCETETGQPIRETIQFDPSADHTAAAFVNDSRVLRTQTRIKPDSLFQFYRSDNGEPLFSTLWFPGNSALVMEISPDLKTLALGTKQTDIDAPAPNFNTR